MTGRLAAVLGVVVLLGGGAVIVGRSASGHDHTLRASFDNVAQLTTGQQDGRAIISVANTGPVIPATEVTRLFRPFERLATPRASNGNGHGLGLSIVAAIADAHSARITAHARPEGGLHIRISFPGQPPDATRTAELRQLQKT